MALDRIAFGIDNNTNCIGLSIADTLLEEIAYNGSDDRGPICSEILESINPDWICMICSDLLYRPFESMWEN